MKKFFCTLAVATSIVAVLGAWIAGGILISPLVIISPLVMAIHAMLAYILWEASDTLCDVIRDYWYTK
jgi:hypothetical protein